MNETAIINVIERSDMRDSNKTKLTTQGYILGNICGKGMPSVPVSVNKLEFKKALSTFGRNSVFTLVFSNKNTFTVMVKEIQYTPLISDYHHIDFQQISLSEKVKSQIAISFIGTELLESKRLLINRQLDTIPVIGFPQDIPDVITIDVSELSLGDSIKISDLSLPTGIITELPVDHIVITMGEPKAHVIEEPVIATA